MFRRLTIEDMDAAAVVHRLSFDHALPCLAGRHTPDEDRWFFKERLYWSCQLWGCFDGAEMSGLIAFRRGWIDQLYVLPAAQRRGIGSELLQIAQQSFARLDLWTFQCNRAARLFYAARGFRLILETDGARNEEKEPDALYRWARLARPPPSA